MFRHWCVYTWRVAPTHVQTHQRQNMLGLYVDIPRVDMLCGVNTQLLHVVLATGGVYTLLGTSGQIMPAEELVAWH